MENTTSTKNENLNFNPFKTFDIKKGICDVCGNEYDAEYKMNVPNSTEPKVFKLEICFSCEREKENKILSKKVEEERKVIRKENLKRMFDENSLINPKLKSVTFESYNPTTDELAKAKQIAQRYADNFSLENPVGLLLIGNYGTGKSHLSVSIVKELMKKDFECIFISTPKLMTKIRSTYNKQSEYTEDQIINQLSKVDCLVLDDIGSESTRSNANDNQHTWATSKLFEIIDNRIGKHTIFTSNYEPSELQKQLGGRNFSRMMENVHVLKMFGEDYRLRDFK
jgi:DNA replication protein DnaC